MATEVFASEEIKLEDGTKVTLKPLVIRDLRKFMAVWNEWIEKVMDIQKKRAENYAAIDNGNEEPHKGVPTVVNTNDMEYDVYIDLLEICYRKQIGKDHEGDEYREYIEDNVSTPVLYRTLKICGELDLETKSDDDDANLQ